MKLFQRNRTGVIWAIILLVMISGVQGDEKKQTVEIDGYKNKVLQLIEDKSKHSAHQYSSVDGQYNLVIQIIGDIPPRQLDEFLKNADDRQELARQLQITEDALVAFTQNVLEKSIDIADWPNRLQEIATRYHACLLYTSPSPRDATLSRMPSSA